MQVKDNYKIIFFFLLLFINVFFLHGTVEQINSRVSKNTSVDTVIPLQIIETEGIDRENEMVHNGIPIAITDNIINVSNLIIEDERGIQIPAAFEVLSRWAGGKDDISKPIQWLLVSFPTTVLANERKNYYLKTGIPIANSEILTVTENENNFVIKTGPAKFLLSKRSMSFLKSIFFGNTKLAAVNGGSSSTIQGQSSARANIPISFKIERKNDFYAVIKIEGDYLNTPVGPRSSKPISYKIRYKFFAGSPTVFVYHKFYWAGYDGDSRGRPSSDYYITLDNVSLILPDMIDYLSTDVYADSSTFLTGTLINSEKASIQQKLRTLFTNPHTALVSHKSNVRTTDFTSKPMLINRSQNGAIAVSIDHMKYFEPQSIVTDANGKIIVNVMSENQDFANLQGSWARVGISALPSNATYSDCLALNYAPLNSRLFVFPIPEYVRTTEAFSELISTSSMNQITQEYYNKIRAITSKTKAFLEEEKFHGLMTWGSMTGYPSLLGDRTGWDKIYEGAWNTDYHNAWNNVIKQFALEGESSYLYGLAFMAARRMLHTQIIQPDWDASSSFMGWGYAGYGRYRSDPNSSHSYFENLFNYYYLTGDMEVIDVIKVGAENKRDDYTRDSNGNLNDPITGGVSWVDRVDRRGMQAAKMFSFIGHTDEVTYLDDFKHIFNQAFSRSLVLLLDNDGLEHGFLSTNQETASGFPTEQIWMVSLYFMDYLYELYNEFGDLRLGVDNLRISRVYEAIMNGFMKYENQTNNGWNQQWYNQFKVNYTGNKIGGRITSIEGHNTSGNPLIMYNSGKFPPIAAFLRAGKIAGNMSLTNYGIEGINWAIGYEEYIEAADDPWGKVNAALFNRLHHAMAYIQPSISIIEPNSRESYDIGTNMNIRWRSLNISNPIKITLWKDSVLIGVIANNIDVSSNSYTWKVGTYSGGTVTGGTGYKIKIKEQGKPISDFSDYPFEINTPEIVVLGPNGNEILGLGRTENIKWRYKALSNNLKITLWKDRVLIGIIANNISPITGSYSWTVGTYSGGIVASGTGYTIKIKEIGTTVSDISDLAFEIVNPQISILTPNGGENWSIGSFQNISWNAKGLSNNIKITLWQNGSLMGVIVSSIDPSLGSYNWNVGSYTGGMASVGSGYQIKIKEKRTTITDYSDSSFEINNH